MLLEERLLLTVTVLRAFPDSWDEAFKFGQKEYFSTAYKHQWCFYLQNLTLLVTKVLANIVGFRKSTPAQFLMDNRFHKLKKSALLLCFDYTGQAVLSDKDREYKSAGVEDISRF